MAQPESTCSIKGCSAPLRARGWCNKHYLRWYKRGGDPTIRLQGGLKKRPVEERFWRHVQREAGDDACWPWRGGCDSEGYGRVTARRNKILRAHRLSWEIHNGRIPDGLHVLHKCDNPPCVNPDHLFLGTNMDNVADMVAKHRQAKGERVGTSVLNTDQVREIRLRASQGEMQIQLADAFGVCVSNINQIVLNRTWTHPGVGGVGGVGPDEP